MLDLDPSLGYCSMDLHRDVSSRKDLCNFSVPGCMIQQMRSINLSVQPPGIKLTDSLGKLQLLRIVPRECFDRFFCCRHLCKEWAPTLVLLCRTVAQKGRECAEKKVSSDSAQIWGGIIINCLRAGFLTACRLGNVSI